MKFTAILKTVFLLTLLSCLARVSAQTTLGYEPFNAAAGTPLSSLSGWTTSGSGSNPVVTSGNLQVTGLTPSTGNMASFNSTAIADYAFSQPYGSNTIFTSFAFQVTDLQTLNSTGEQFVSLQQSGLNEVASLWIRKNATSGFDLGLNREFNVSTSIWTNSGGSGFSTSQTYFALLEYDQGSSYSTAELWLAPYQSGFAFNSDTQISPLLSMGSGANNLGVNQLQFGPFASDVSTQPISFSIDEVRVATTMSAAAVPEPSAYTLFGIAAFVLVIARKRKEKGASLF